MSVVCVRAGCRRTSKASSVPLLLWPDWEENKKIGLTRTPLSLHFTARQKPIPPSPRSEREKRGQRSPPLPQPPLTDNEENTAGRREEEKSEMS